MGLNSGVPQPPVAEASTMAGPVPPGEPKKENPEKDAKKKAKMDKFLAKQDKKKESLPANPEKVIYHVMLSRQRRLNPHE